MYTKYHRLYNKLHRHRCTGLNGNIPAQHKVAIEYKASCYRVGWGNYAGISFSIMYGIIIPELC